ncbi:MAG: Na+:solute symporter [Bacteroidia bacterium]|nr:Na+:solute symporter [Bacteroidia bacterium]
MNLSYLDIGILIGYLILTIFIGFWISKRASQNMESYFLGGKTIPWFMLGLSNASGMFDISGTMWMVYLLFVYGLKSVWIPWLWPVFNQIFMMVYLSMWLRRSGVMTGAEWIRFRFGVGKGSEGSHIMVVIFALLNVIGFLAYGFIGIGKFAAIFLPWELSADPVWNANLYGLLLTAITTLYVVKGGMFSVVFTEVLQFVVMTIACVAVGIIAMVEVSPQMLQAAVPAGWGDIFFGWALDIDWSAQLAAANQKIAEDGYELFTIFFMMVLFKGYLQAGAGPNPNYDMQRVLSAKSPADAAKMSGIVNVVMLIPRYMLVAGLTVLALAHFIGDLHEMGPDVDFELILPMAMKGFLPSGLLGLLIAGLLAAFMSTYAATVNSAPAYIVNDIYKRYINPHASDKRLVGMSYLSSILVVIVGTAFGFLADSLNDLVQWIVSALYGGYTASNLLKWYWWRFNSQGYFWGMVSGIFIALFFVLPYGEIFALSPGASRLGDLLLWVDQMNPLNAFLYIFAGSMTTCLVLSYLTPHDDMEVLKKFYFKVRPWGFWKPVHAQLLAEYPNLEANRNAGRDMLNVIIGIAWQTALTATGIFLVIQDWTSLAITIAIVLGSTIWLKFQWYDRLRDYPTEVHGRQA